MSTDSAIRPGTADAGRRTSGASREPKAGAGISRFLVLLFATTAGLSAANIYYAQPLLTSISGGFHVTSNIASLVVTAGPVGYALGLAFLVPLGDAMNRRRLVMAMLSVVVVFQALAAVAPNIGALIGIEAIAAIVSTVSPLMVSFAATLALPAERGKVTGAVMSGVLLGVLLARTAGGVIAQFDGWRTVYAAAAVVVLVLVVLLWRVLPSMVPDQKVDYGKLLRSSLTLLKEEPVLRLRTAYGFFSQAGFQVLWTSVAFLLASSRYGFNEGTIGLFGFAGLVGAVGARVTGRWTDRGMVRPATGFLLASILLGWGLMALHGGNWVVALVAGIVVLDFGVQGMQVMNLSTIYELRPEARSRLTTAYMTLYLVGGVAGSAASGAAYAVWGWLGVCAVGAAFAAAALAMWVGAEVLRRQQQQLQPAV